jgi:hypothetical protein
MDWSTLRKEDGDIPKVALLWTPQGHRSRGRPSRQMVYLALTSNTLLNFQYDWLRHCVYPEWDNSWSYSVMSFKGRECNA